MMVVSACLSNFWNNGVCLEVSLISVAPFAAWTCEWDKGKVWASVVRSFVFVSVRPSGKVVRSEGDWWKVEDFELFGRCWIFAVIFKVLMRIKSRICWNVKVVWIIFQISFPSSQISLRVCIIKSVPLKLVRKIIAVYCDNFRNDINNSLWEDAVIVNDFEVSGI